MTYVLLLAIAPYPLLFDTDALRASGIRSLYPVLSYREFFTRAKDAVAVVDLGFNVIRWTSSSLGDVQQRPYLGVERVKGRFRIGLIGEGCH